MLKWKIFHNNNNNKHFSNVNQYIFIVADCTNQMQKHDKCEKCFVDVDKLRVALTIYAIPL